jgi:hypothetical protein
VRYTQQYSRLFWRGDADGAQLFKTLSELLYCGRYRLNCAHCQRSLLTSGSGGSRQARRRSSLSPCRARSLLHRPFSRSELCPGTCRCLAAPDSAPCSATFTSYVWPQSSHMLRASGTNGTAPHVPSDPRPLSPQDVLTPPTPVADGAGAHDAAAAAGKHHAGLSTQQASIHHVRPGGSQLIGLYRLSQREFPHQQPHPPTVSAVIPPAAHPRRQRHSNGGTVTMKSRPSRCGLWRRHDCCLPREAQGLQATISAT